MVPGWPIWSKILAVELWYWVFLFRNQINNWKNWHKSKLTHQTESLTFYFSYFLTPCSPKYRGTYCLGERRRYKICNITPCPQEVPTFRDVQCGHFNVLPYKGKFYKWETVFNKGEQAKLMPNCRLETLFHVTVTLFVLYWNPFSQPLWAALPPPEWKFLGKVTRRRHRWHAVLRGQQKQRYVHQRHL